MGNRLFRILVILAAVMGADGVMLAAAAAHQPDATRLAAASSMLLFHATAVIGAVVLAERGLVDVRIGIAAGFGFVVATALFAAFASSLPIALYMLGCGVIGLIAVSMLTDHTNKDVSQEYEGV